MPARFKYIYNLSLIALYTLLFGSMSFGQTVWNTSLDSTTSWSSPRLVDLNGDDILDVVIGGGADEIENPSESQAPTDLGYVALDGQTGDTLWNTVARWQVYASPTFIDITNDQVLDVIMGGRFAEMKAVNGVTGEVIWEFFPYDPPIVASDSGWYNFYSCQLIPDQNGDGIDDLLTANGGDALVGPNDPNRPPGNLVILSSIDGAVIAKAQVPDDAETYCSPVVARFGDDTLRVVYGTGGETLPGGLWRCKLSDVIDEDLADSELLHFSDSNGYVAPPSLVDLNGDGVFDIVANSYDDHLVAVDGDNLDLMWEKVVQNAECNGNPSVGWLNADQVPDVVSIMAIGEWPHYNQFIRYLIDGVDGSVIDSMILPFADFSATLLIDVNSDGIDELLTVGTEPDFSGIEPVFHVNVRIRDIANAVNLYDTLFYGSSLIISPIIGDLDNNDQLDIILGYTNDSISAFSTTGLNVCRIELPFNLPAIPSWSGYQGTYSTGIFAPQQVLVSTSEYSDEMAVESDPPSISSLLLELEDDILFADIYGADGRRIQHLDYVSKVELLNSINRLKKGVYILDLTSQHGERLGTFKFCPM